MQKDNKITLWRLLPTVIAMLPIYILLHETGHTIVAIMYGAENVRISIFSASMTADFVEYTPFAHSLLNSAGMLFPVIIFSIFAFVYNPGKTSILYRCFYYSTVPIAFGPIFAWVFVPIIGMLSGFPPGDDVTNFIDNSGWHPGVVVILALILIALLVLLFSRKGIFKLIVTTIKQLSR